MILIICKARSFRRTLAIVLPTLSAALLSVAPTALADTITYSFLPQPEPDLTNGGGYQVDLSGAVTFSGLPGALPETFNSSNDSGITLSSDLTMTTTDGPVSVMQSGSTTLASALGGGTILLTPTGLFVNSSTTFELENSETSEDPLVEVLWNLANSGEYQGAGDAVAFNGNSMSFQTFSADSYLVDGQWEIAAAVPEPATLSLFATALLGLGVVGLRRRKKQAHRRSMAA